MAGGAGVGPSPRPPPRPEASVGVRGGRTCHPRRQTGPARLAQAGWHQACAPHRARFERVPGGWRPRPSGASGADALPRGTPWQAQGLDPDDPLAAGLSMTRSHWSGTVGARPAALAPAPSSPRRPQHPRAEPFVAGGGSPRTRWAVRGSAGGSAAAAGQWASQIRGGQRCPARKAGARFEAMLAMVGASAAEAASAWRAAGAGEELASAPSHFGSSSSGSEDSHDSDLEGRCATIVEGSGETDGPKSGTAARDGCRLSLMRRPSLRDLFSSRSASRRTSIVVESQALGLPEVLEEVHSAVEALGSLSQQQRRRTRQTIYAERLVANADVLEQAKASNLNECEIAELATLFAECDVAMRGLLDQYSLQYFLRRLGRAFSITDLNALVESVREYAPDTLNSMLDFLDLVEVLGFMKDSARVFLNQVFEGIGGDGFLSLHRVADVLQEIGFCPRLEQLKQTAAELHVFPVNKRGSLVLTQQEQLVQLAESARRQEQQRFHERAGFTNDEVAYFRWAFDKQSPTGAELQPDEVRQMLRLLGIALDSHEDKQDLETMMRGADQDSNGTLSFWEILHLLRRLVGHQEARFLDHERKAAEEAGLTTEEVNSLRQLYQYLGRDEAAAKTQGWSQGPSSQNAANKRWTTHVFSILPDEEDAERVEMTYQALAKAVRLLGATLTMEHNTFLDRIFRLHAEPPKGRCRRLLGPVSKGEGVQLTFLKFLLVMGTLWWEDFAGMLSTSTAQCLAEPDGGQGSVLARVVARAVGAGNAASAAGPLGARGHRPRRAQSPYPWHTAGGGAS